MEKYLEVLAENFINDYFPNCTAALLAGSVVHGRTSDQSDLDLLIFDESKEEAYLQCFLYENRRIEAFVFTESTYLFTNEANAVQGIPTLYRMCAEGLILKDNHGKASELKEISALLLENGPHPLTKERIDASRYMITDLLLDFIDTKDEKENFFTVTKLVDMVNEFILRTNRQWLGHGKWNARALRQFDEGLYGRFVQTFEDYWVNKNKQSLIQFIDDLLAPHGGRLTDGFKQRFL